MMIPQQIGAFGYFSQLDLNEQYQQMNRQLVEMEYNLFHKNYNLQINPFVDQSFFLELQNNNNIPSIPIYHDTQTIINNIQNDIQIHQPVPHESGPESNLVLETANNDIIIHNTPKKTKTKKKRKRVMKNTNCPHKNAKHYAKNMCSSCYHLRGRVKKAWKCEHINEFHYALGLCYNCYFSQHKKNKKEKKENEKISSAKKPNETTNDESKL